MRKLVFIAGAILILVACSTEKMNFNKLQDRNGLYYLVNKEEPFSGEVIAYVNGTTEFEGIIDKGLKTGIWTYYYANGQKKMEGTYKDGVKDGTWTYWKENGEVDIVENYKFGQLLNNDGTVRIAADTVSADTVQTEAKAVVEKQEAKPEPKVEKGPKTVKWEQLKGGPVKYYNGVPYTGPVVKYYPNGVRELDGNYYRGQRSGKWTFYDKLGNVKDVKQY